MLRLQRRGAIWYRGHVILRNSGKSECQVIMYMNNIYVMLIINTDLSCLKIVYLWHG